MQLAGFLQLSHLKDFDELLIPVCYELEDAFNLYEPSGIRESLV